MTKKKHKHVLLQWFSICYDDIKTVVSALQWEFNHIWVLDLWGKVIYETVPYQYWEAYTLISFVMLNKFTKRIFFFIFPGSALGVFMYISCRRCQWHQILNGKTTRVDVGHIAIYSHSMGVKFQEHSQHNADLRLSIFLSSFHSNSMWPFSLKRLYHL